MNLVVNDVPYELRLTPDNSQLEIRKSEANSRRTSANISRSTSPSRQKYQDSPFKAEDYIPDLDQLCRKGTLSPLTLGFQRGSNGSNGSIEMKEFKRDFVKDQQLGSPTFNKKNSNELLNSSPDTDSRIPLGFKGLSEQEEYYDSDK